MTNLKTLRSRLQALESPPPFPKKPSRTNGRPQNNTFAKLRQARLAELATDPPLLETIVFMTRLLAEARANGNNRSLNNAVERQVRRMVPEAFRHAVRVLRRLRLQNQTLTNADICTARKIRSEAREVARAGAEFLRDDANLVKHMANHTAAIDDAFAHLKFVWTQQNRLRRLRS